MNPRARELANAQKWLKRYRKAMRQTVGEEREKYAMAVRNFSGYVSVLARSKREASNNQQKGTT